MTCRCTKQVLSYGIAQCKEPSRRPYTVFYDDEESSREAIVYKGPPFKSAFFTVATSDLEPCTPRQLAEFLRKYPAMQSYIVSEWVIQHTKRCQAAQKDTYDPAEARGDIGSGTVTLTRTEADALRDLLDYLRRGWVGPHAQTVKALRERVGK